MACSGARGRTEEVRRQGREGGGHALGDGVGVGVWMWGGGWLSAYCSCECWVPADLVIWCEQPGRHFRVCHAVQHGQHHRHVLTTIHTHPATSHTPRATWLPALFACSLPPCLPPSPPPFLPPCLAACLPPSLPLCLPACLRACGVADLPTLAAAMCSAVMPPLTDRPGSAPNDSSTSTYTSTPPAHHQYTTSTHGVSC